VAYTKTKSSAGEARAIRNAVVYLLRRHLAVLSEAEPSSERVALRDHLFALGANAPLTDAEAHAEVEDSDDGI